MDPNDKALIDIANHLARINRGANLVQLPPPPTRRDTSLAITPRPESRTMSTAKSNTSSATLAVQPFVEEYLSNHVKLRRDGVSLADYCQSGMRDAEPSYTLSTDLRDILDSVQAKRCGGVADPTRPLSVVV